jgi:TRAP-type C4-dicarboxylate transport system substrate-binding protein
MTLKGIIKSAALAAAATTLMTAAPAAVSAKEVTLTLVYPFPDFLIYMKQCKQLAADITKAGAGKVKIDVKPFNTIKMFQQPGSVKSGRVDITCIPAAFYARAVPENEAISTSSTTAAKARASGAIKIIDDLQQKYFGVKYLGWTSAGNHFRLYTKNPPKFGKDGLPDLTGVKLRGNPIYGALFKALKGSAHPLAATQVYAALEKGVVDAAAWATFGLRGLKWDKFLRHAVVPNFYQTDIGWIINLKRWKSLDKATQDLIQGMVIKAEASSEATLVKAAIEEEKALKAGGMKFYTVPAADKYLKLAVDSAYNRMMGRLKKAGRPTDHVAKLRSLWQQ